MSEQQKISRQDIEEAVSENGLTYLEEMTMLLTVCKLLKGIDLEFLQRGLAYANAMGPILMPTEYRDGMDNLRDQERVLAKALPLKRVVEEIGAEACK